VVQLRTLFYWDMALHYWWIDARCFEAVWWYNLQRSKCILGILTLECETTMLS